ncbi:MAG: hypothetical protein AAFR61_32335, partial [Bacteroidota bacterium]
MKQFNFPWMRLLLAAVVGMSGLWVQGQTVTKRVALVNGGTFGNQAENAHIIWWDTEAAQVV